MVSDLNIEVCFALADRQYHYSLQVAAGTTIGTAIRQSGLLDECPELALERSRVGVYGEFRGLDDTVSEGDRIEIYRPLKTDPMESRRKRARSG